MSETNTEPSLPSDEGRMIEDLRSQLNQREAELKRVSAELSDVQRSLGVRNAELADARWSLSRLEDENRRLRAEVADLQASLSRWRFGGGLLGVLHLLRR